MTTRASLIQTIANLHADGYATCDYNICNDSATFSFYGESFHFKGLAVLRCHSSSFIRDKPPYIRVMPYDRLRELVEKYPEDCK